jgi:type I restriction enzyme S subunit
MLDWRRVTIGELCEDGEAELQTGPFGSQLHAYDYIPDGIPVVPTEAIGNRQIDYSVLPKISFNKAEELRRHWLEPGDILFARRGVQATGHIGYIRGFENGFVCGTGAIRLRIRQNSGISPEYVSHVLADPVSVAWFKYHAIGATMPNLNEGIIRSFPITLPPIGEQRAIARILSALDDKVELNRGTNELLEAVARALFKSWFVDFDPVRAKVEGRDARLPEPIADFFPTSFIDSELGKIPAGWGVSRLGKEAATVLGGTPSRREPAYWGGEIPWINSGKANEFRVIEPSEFITEKGLKSSATKLLPNRTTIIAITGATLGQISLTEIETSANQSIVGVLGSDALPSEYPYFWVKQHVEDLLAWQTGGAQQHINKNNVNYLPLLLPTRSVMRVYFAKTRPIFDRIRASCYDSGGLTAIRDALLPKLISGQIRVKDTERFVERAV